MPINPLPTPPSRQDAPATFVSRADAFLGAFPAFRTEANALETNVNAKEASATLAATAADASKVAAAASESGAVAAANVTKFDGAVTYAQGAVVWSPTDFKSYRRKSAGTSATDPASDTPNWAPLVPVAGIAASDTTSTAGNLTLLSTSDGYQSLATTALGKHVTLPDAALMTVGGPRFIIKNDGGYPFGIRDSAGTLIMAVAAGGIAYVTLRDNSTTAGSWSVIGDNLEPGLITVDNTFSSTFTATVLAPFVALDDNTSIHFAALSAGFAAFIVDNTGKVVTTPVTVTTAASMTPRQVFKVSSTSAIVFYSDGTNSHGVIITLSGASPSYSLTLGTAVAGTGVTAENFTGAPKVVQLTPMLYLCSTATTGVFAVAMSVSGATITVGSLATIIGSGAVADSTTTYALTSTTALVLYMSGGAAPLANNAVVISVSGTTCTVGTPAAATGCASSSGVGSVASSALLSPTKCIIGGDNNATSAVVSGFTISGTTITAWTALTLETSISAGNMWYGASDATRYNPRLFSLSANTALLWYFQSGISRVVVLTESSGTVTAGTILYRSISAATAAAAGAGIILSQGTSEFVAIRAQGAAKDFTLNAHKINGTTITEGSGIAATEIPESSSINYYFTRLSSGTYVMNHGFPAGATDKCGVVTLPVFKSNGDFIKDLGTVAVPPIAGIISQINLGVSSNRLVLIGRTFSTTVSSTAQQLRLLNLEIAQ